MRLFLAIFILFFFAHLSQAQKSQFSFFSGIDYDLSYSINDNFNSYFVYNQGQYTNAGTIYFGAKKGNLYAILGVSRYNRTLDLPCVAFEEVPPNQIQFAPSDLIIYDTPNDNCEYALKLKKKFIELPFGVGYTFQVKKKIEAFVEARYAPILTIKSFRNLEDLMIGTSYIQSSAKTWVHSRKNISIRGGFLKTVNKYFLLKLGILLKSNDFGFDKMLVGGNVGIQYTFHPKVK